MELINKILDLPIIVQGALGSALFWFFLESGQRFLRLCSKVSANITDHKNTALYIALGSVAHDSLERRKFLFQGMVHGVLHYFIKAMIFIVLGLSCQSFIPVLGFVGYFGALIYLFRAIAYVPHLDQIKDVKSTFDKLNIKDNSKTSSQLVEQESFASDSVNQKEQESKRS